MLDPRKYRNGGAFLVMLLTALGANILSPSVLPLLEQSVCRSYYLLHDPATVGKDGSVPEMKCKGSEIQKDLASLAGWSQFFALFPGLVLTVLYGRLAETTSKKLILMVNTISRVLAVLYFLAVCYFYQYFNIRMIWLSSLFDIFGGGAPILGTLLYTIIAEGTDPASLSSTYYKLSASLLATKLLGMTTGAYILQRGIWLPSRVGLVVYSFGIPALLLLPSSPSPPQDLPSATKDVDENDPLLPPETPVTLQQATPLPVLPLRSRGIRFLAQPRAAIVDFMKSFHIAIDLFVHDKLSRICLSIFFLNMLAIGVRIILQQWASKSFGWTLAETSYIFSFMMLIGGLVLASLPFISRRLLKPRLGSTRRTDLWIMKMSLLMNITGAICISLAPKRAIFIISVAVYSLGTGLPDTLKSFATGFLEKDQITKLYVGISLVESVGALVSGPLWTGVYRLTLSVGFLGLGFPFWVCGGTFFCAFVMVWVLERHLGVNRLVVL